MKEDLNLLVLSSRPVTRGGSRGSSEPPFLRTPLPKIRTPPPQTFQLHTWHRIPLMPISSVVPPIRRMHQDAASTPVLYDPVDISHAHVALEELKDVGCGLTLEQKL